MPTDALPTPVGVISTCSASETRPTMVEPSAFPWVDDLILDFTVPIRVIVGFMSVVLPLERLEIAQIVYSTLGNGLDMVDLPTPLLSFAVLASLHTRAAFVLSE